MFRMYIYIYIYHDNDINVIPFKNKFRQIYLSHFVIIVGCYVINSCIFSQYNNAHHCFSSSVILDHCAYSIIIKDFRKMLYTNIELVYLCENLIILYQRNTLRLGNNKIKFETVLRVQGKSFTFSFFRLLLFVYRLKEVMIFLNHKWTFVMTG